MAESKLIKKPELKSLSEIFATRDLRVDIPKFQRDYVWGKVQWENLWADIKDLNNGTTDELFIGFVIGYITKDGPVSVLNIVDGQQRLITLSIILSVLRRKHDSIDLSKSFILSDLFKQEYQKIKFSKISTHNSEKLFNEIVYGDKKVNKVEETNLERNIYECFEFYTKAVDELVKTFDDVTNIANAILSKIPFSLTTTETYENAKTLFQVLNSFSVSLGPADLFKSHMLDVNDTKLDSENEKIADRWNDLKREITGKKIKFEEFLLRFAMSHSGYLKKENFYDPLKEILKDQYKNKADNFLDSIEEEAEFYLQVCLPGERFIERPTYDEIYHLLRVYSSLNVSEPDVFFYACIRELSKATKNKNSKLRHVLTAFLNFTIVRYKLKGDGRAYMHENYPEWAVEIRKLSSKYDALTDISSIFNEDKINKLKVLNAPYFKAASTGQASVVEREIAKLTYSSNEKNKKKYSRDYLLVKYLLAVYYFGDDVGEMRKTLSSNGDTYTIEHIEPDSSTSFGESRFRFGNLMLVAKDKYGNKSFLDKLPEYSKDSILIKVKDPILNKKSWSQEDVDKRGLEIAKVIAKKLAA